MEDLIQQVARASEAAERAQRVADEAQVHAFNLGKDLQELQQRLRSAVQRRVNEAWRDQQQPKEGTNELPKHRPFVDEDAARGRF